MSIGVHPRTRHASVSRIDIRSFPLHREPFKASHLQFVPDS
jgi:hypothetical protein